MIKISNIPNQAPCYWSNSPGIFINQNSAELSDKKHNGIHVKFIYKLYTNTRLILLIEQKRMKRKTVIILVIVVIAVAGPLLYFKLHKKAAAVTYQTGQASKGTLISTVSGSGNIVVSSSANVSPGITGTVANLKVAVGDQVKKGQIMFTITNPDLDVAVSQAYTALLQAQQKLTQAQSQLTTDKQNYTSVKQGAATQAQLALNQAQQDLAQAQSQLEQDQNTYQKYLDENALHAGTHSAADINLIQSKITTDLTTISAKESNVTSAQTNLTKAKASTSTDISTAKAKVDSDNISVQAAQNDVNSAQLNYTNQKDNAAKRTVVAPIAGTVSTLNVANGDTLGSSSNSASNSSNGASAVIQDLSSLKAVIAVNEVDIASVKIDQKTSMTFDAIDSLTLTGKVEKVDTVGTVSQGVVSYSATIGFDSLDARVKPGMSVNADVTTEVKQDVLMVPSSAVKTSGTVHYVQILQNGAPIQQTVETGISSDTQTEITSGLSVGDSVITQTITAGKSTTNTNSSSSAPRGGQGFGGGEVQIFTGPPGS